MAEKDPYRLVEGFLASQQIDRIADYVQRGRKYRPLSDDDLLAKWLASVKAMADAPLESSHRDAYDDTEAELSLRKIDRPYDAAEPDFERYMQATDAELQKIKRDPQQLSDLKDRLVEDLRAFEDERDRSD